MAEPSPSLVARARAFAFALARNGARLRLSQAAGSLAFLSLLAVVPVFTIAVSLLGALPMFEGLRDAVLNFVAANLFLPSFSDTLVGYLNQFADKTAELSMLGAAVFFASAFTALITIEGTLNRIWDTGQRRPFARRLTIYWTFLTLGPLLVAASTAVNGLIASESLFQVPLPALRTAWLALLPWTTAIVGLTLLYRLVPSATVRWRDALIGALAAAVVLELLKRGMAMQMGRLPTYTVVYGAFAALPLFFMWLFMLWLTVLGGALVAASVDYRGAGATPAARPSAATRFDSAAAVLSRLVAASAQGRGALAAGEMMALFGADPARAAQAAGTLCDLGYLERAWRLSGDRPADGQPAIWDELWMLAPDAGERSLRALFECVWRDAAATRDAPPELLDLSRIDAPLSAGRSGDGSAA